MKKNKRCQVENIFLSRERIKANQFSTKRAQKSSETEKEEGKNEFDPVKLQDDPCRMRYVRYVWWKT